MLKINNYTNYILEDISFDLEGKNLIILGSNGSGKTTLARVLSGLIPSDTVSCEDKNPSQLYGSARTKLINYIPVGLDIFDEFINVLEFLELNCLYGNHSVDEVLEFLNISYLKNKSCKHLSSGEAQLTLMAGSILHNAKFTIFDELTSNLDPVRVKMVYELLKNEQLLQNKVIITHNLNLAFKLGYDVLYLEDGKIKFFGSNDEFFNSDNLDMFFNKSVRRINNHIVVDL
ncbi:MAG: ATP-binding cassette domain-containing protein [Arcobacteraceae bacterium]|nr:ATP-binding cassette domain-containing protein [Arcobacteraceae bacterium]